MSQRFSTKDKHEKEQEEAERLVRESPKKKPPRNDRARNHIKVEDPDVDGDPDTSDDKDLSMNYKDIGGNVARRYMLALNFDPELAESEDDVIGLDKEDDTEGDDEETSEDDTTEEDSTEEDSEEESQEEKKPRQPTDDEIDAAALKMYTKPASKLQDMLSEAELSDTERNVVLEALQLKTNPLPPKWDRESAFEDGTITLKERRRFRKHMSNWDSKQFGDNLNYFKEQYLNESLTEGRKWYERYFEVMIELVKEAWSEFQKKDVSPMKSVYEEMDDLKNPEREFDSSAKKELEEDAERWRQMLRRTSNDKVKELIQEVEELQQESESNLSVRHAWLSKLKYILEGALEMKKSASQARLVSSSIRSGFRKAAQYRGLPGPLEDDDYYKPPRPKWRKPDPMDLGPEDYGKIVKEAKKYLKKPFLANDLVPYNPEMACRLALDYSIWDLEEGKYQATIDVPTYNNLLEVLQRITED